MKKTTHTGRLQKELHMSPNQIQDIIRRHEEKNNVKANKKKELSVSSKAYELFSKGKSSLEVAITLDIPQTQVTQFRSQYWKLKGQDRLVILHSLLGDRIFSFFRLYNELIIKREMSIERVAYLVETALDKLPYVEIQYEQAKQETDRLQEKVDYLENRKSILGIKEKYRIITLPSSSYSYVNERETPSFSSGPSSLPYLSSENYDPWGEYRKNKRTQ
jgi:hypothetical protein